VLYSLSDLGSKEGRTEAASALESLGIYAEFLKKDRVRLREDYLRNYTLAPGFVFSITVPKGFVTDGASIPRWIGPVPVWNIIGHPFESQFLGAALVHDLECRERTRQCSGVHKLFYRLLREDGVGEKRANAMWRAVHHFGPQWVVTGL
jgi:hypothetical protein